LLYPLEYLSAPSFIAGAITGAVDTTLQPLRRDEQDKMSHIAKRDAFKKRVPAMIFSVDRTLKHR